MHEPPAKKFDPQQIVSSALRSLQYWRLLTVTLAVGLLAGAAYFMYARPVFMSRALVNVKIFNSPVAESAAGASSLISSTPTHLIRRGLLSELQSLHLILHTARRLGLVDNNASYESVRDDHLPKLEVALLDNNHVQITAYTFEPEVARKFPEALVSEHQSFQRDIQRRYRQEAWDRYQKEFDELKKRVGQGTDMLASFEKDNELTRTFIEANNLTKVPTEMVLIKDQLRRMTEAREQIRGEDGDLPLPLVIEQLSLLSALAKEAIVDVGNVVEGAGPEPPVDGSGKKPATRITKVVVQPDMVESVEPWRELEKEYRTLVPKIEEGRKIYRGDNDKLKVLLDRRDAIDRELRAALEVARNKYETDYRRKQDRLKELEAQLPEYHDVSAKYEHFRRNFGLMEKSQGIWDKTYEALTSKLATVEYELDKDRVTLTYNGFVSLRDRDPISPNKMKLFLVALAVGLGGGIGLVTLVQLMDSSTSRLQELESVTGLKGLGIIPFSSKTERENVFRSPAIGSKVPNSLLESFRLIRSHVCLDTSRDGGCQVVLITSARPGEGKTSLATNLAWAFYSMGERTLVVDCDMRRGRVHQMTKSPNEIGLSTILTGRSLVHESVSATQAENLDVVTRGPIIVGATEKLIQADFEALINQWRTQYDRIVLDCPPLLGLSETASASRVADGVILVVKAESTARKDVIDANEVLRKAGAHVLGFVLNALDLKKWANSYQYYYYSAAYYDLFDDGDESSPPPAPRRIAKA